jgi:hypothetical protein
MSIVAMAGAAPPSHPSSSSDTDSSLLLDGARASLYIVALAYCFIGLYAITDPTMTYCYQRGYKMSRREVLPLNAFVPVLSKGVSCAFLC